MSAPPAIEPAILGFNDRGTPVSERYDDVYHASAGGLEQARHVFLGGNGLPGRWQGQARFTILETGFGQGLNFLATWAAWKDDPDRCERLHFLSVEKHPFRREDLVQLHRHYPAVAPLAAQLQAQWPALTAGFHRLEFEGGRVVLTLALGDAQAAIPQFVAEPDALYLDGFSPAKNPELWSAGLLSEIALLCRRGTTLATWAVAGPVREALKTAGFHLEKRPGFAFKREMLVGTLARGDAATPPPPIRHAIVVGAGLAGSLCTEALTRRGWTVELFERRPGPAQETSGNRSAVMLPMLSLDDNRTSRLNRACYLHALRQVAQWRAAGAAIDGKACGVLQIARDATHREKQRDILARCGFPDSYVRFVEAEEAAALTGMAVSDGGWWFGGGAWWNPATLCQAALAQAGQKLTARFDTAVTSIEPLPEGGWRVLAPDGWELARAPHLILANAHDLLRLPQCAHLPLFRFRGQVSHLPVGAHFPLRAVVCREGYVSPAQDGLLSVGASFQREGDPALTAADHRANLDRLTRMLPTALAGLPALDAETLPGRVGFRPVSPDKLPMLGQLHHPQARPQGRDFSAVERWPGLHIASGYGARGLVWSVLMGELLASQLNGDPLPLEAQLAATVDPARFLLRQKFEPASGE